MAITFDILKPEAKIFQELKKIHLGGQDSRTTLLCTSKYAKTIKSTCILRVVALLAYTIVASIRSYRSLLITNTLTSQLHQRVMLILNVVALLMNRKRQIQKSSCAIKS